MSHGRRKPSFIRERIHKKVHKNGRSRKDPREEKRLVPLLSSSNMSSISNKNFIHHSKKDIQKYLNLVEADNIRENMIFFLPLLSQTYERSTRKTFFMTEKKTYKKYLDLREEEKICQNQR